MTYSSENIINPILTLKKVLKEQADKIFKLKIISSGTQVFELDFYDRKLASHFQDDFLIMQKEGKSEFAEFIRWNSIKRIRIDRWMKEVNGGFEDLIEVELEI